MIRQSDTLKAFSILFGFILLWLVLELSARLLGSFRGEYGIAVAVLVLTAAFAVERFVWKQQLSKAARHLGLTKPHSEALIWTIILSVVLMCFFPVYGFLTETPITMRADWPVLLPGLIAQGGIAEEIVFRGYLFRHFRDGRSFWRAALISAVPFIAVHLMLFASLDFVVALIALLVALSLTFPLAWLFERSGNSIWPPAILHFSVQGSIKMLDVEQADFILLAISWMMISAAIPWAVFLILPRAENNPPGRGD